MLADQLYKLLLRPLLFDDVLVQCVTSHSRILVLTSSIPRGLLCRDKPARQYCGFACYYTYRCALWLHVCKLATFTSQSALSFTITLTWSPSWSLSLSTRLQYKFSPPFQQPRSCSLSTHLFLPVFRNRNSLTSHCTSKSAHWNCSWAGIWWPCPKQCKNFGFYCWRGKTTNFFILVLEHSPVVLSQVVKPSLG